MAANTAQVKCINKHPTHTDPHRRIQNIGGFTDKAWKVSTDWAIGEIEANRWGFWTTTPQGHTVWLVVAVHEGHKYLKTQSDGIHPNNLLALPECP